MRRPIDRLNRGRVPAKGGIFVAPPFAITSPADLSDVVSGVPIAVSGSSPGVAAVNVTGNAVAIGSSPVVGNAWSVPWTPGALGAVALAATDGALNANISVTVISAVAFAFTNPAALSSVPVGTPITVSGTSPSASAVTVTANGVPIGGSPVVGNVWSFSWTPTIAAATTLAATDGTLNANISITVTSGAPSTPITIVTSLVNQTWIRADLGIVEAGGAGTGVSQWTDQSTFARHFIQTANAAARPLLSASGGPNGTPIIIGDGVDDFMVSPIVIPLISTTPVFFWIVCLSLTQTSGEPFFCGQSSTRVRFAQFTNAGECRLNSNNSGPTNTNLPLGVGRRCEAWFNNNTTDYLKVGAQTQTGVILGTNGATTLGLFAVTTGVSPVNGGICEFAIWPGLPTPAELAALDAYASARYGAGVLA